jgi:hypothetical protein
MLIPAVMNRVTHGALCDRLKARLLTTGPTAEYAAWHRARMIHADPAQAGLLRQVLGAIALPALPERRTVRGTVWGISVVRNEADIIAPVIEHLFRQGVDAVLIADNGSTDETPLLLANLAKRYPVHVAVDTEKGHYQAFKMTILSDFARKAGADWIVPFDADEFWFAPESTLGDFLRKSKSKRMRAEMHNLYPVPGVRFEQGPWSLERQPCEFQKVVFRSHRHAILADGNHDVLRPGRWSAGPRIVHVPWRSREQFRRKTLDGAQALAETTLGPDVGWHWRNLAALDDQAAEQVWERIEQGESVNGIAWSPGTPARIVDPLKWESWNPDEILEVDARP